MTKSVFLPYQAALMEAVRTHQVTVIEKSRRTGISWAASFIADLTAALAQKDGGTDVFYIGYNLEMAREFIDYCADHAKIMQQATHRVSESFWNDPDKEEKDIKVFRIDFGSGNKVLALPSRPRALRGMQGLVIIDEAAFHDNLDELLKAALALLMWGGKVLIISTHNGDMNPFNTLVNEVRSGRKPYHLMRLTLDDALHDGLYRKICDKKGEAWSLEGERAWRDAIFANYGEAAAEELDCIPSSGTGAYLPLALIEARTEADVPVVRWGCDSGFVLLSEKLRMAETDFFISEQLAPLLAAMDRKTPHVFGVDFGRSGDLTVIWMLALEERLQRRTAFVVELRNVPFEQQKQILHHILEATPFLRAGALDGRGNGQYLAEVTVQKFGSRIEAVMLSEGWYRENMPPLKAGFEDGIITLPQDREIVDDLRALTLVRGVARVPEGRTTGSTGKRHGDAGIALALAWKASRATPFDYGYTPVPSPWKRHEGAGHIETAQEQEERDRMGAASDVFGVIGKVIF
ncbi:MULTISPECIES: terminase large subunit domain-containing protein [unclassified Saccharibacter]|uniref:terminase large subunit domain-containing protein n=1 Tax=unclassified Saccharibacter TaxID=2648722 RepID=UPI00132CA43A|nr:MULTISPECIES: terminase family protein [unclassified Saccharibacter]MXV35827.1 hypothetical protein [Saccharibacter sp. EH611]MXV57948.1 hypothetical protein [Saccharibacter sp. EH70]MXV66343.1 hypothetical protein [Saccharibacter sp. EH60]